MHQDLFFLIKFFTERMSVDRYVKTIANDKPRAAKSRRGTTGFLKNADGNNAWLDFGYSISNVGEFPGVNMPKRDQNSAGMTNPDTEHSRKRITFWAAVEYHRILILVTWCRCGDNVLVGQ